MLRRACGAALLVLVGLGLPAYGQTTLEWKFKEGDKFYVEETNDMKQSITFIALNKEIKQNSKTTILSSYTVKKVAAAGKEVTLVQKIENVDVKTSGDSLGGTMEKVLEKLQGAVFTFTLKNGQVTKLEGYNDFIKKLADGDETTATFAKELLSEELIKMGLDGTFGNLPDKAVKADDVWSKNSTVPLGPLGSFKTTNDYTFKDQDKDGAHITYKMKMKYEAPKAGGAFGGLLTIVKSTLKSDNGKGTIDFDAEKGRLIRASNSMVMRGGMTVEAMGNRLELSLNVDQSTSTRVLAKNPKSD